MENVLKFKRTTWARNFNHYLFKRYFTSHIWNESEKNIKQLYSFWQLDRRRKDVTTKTTILLPL